VTTPKPLPPVDESLVTGATTAVSTTGVGAFVLADLPKLEEAVPNRFRGTSVIFGNRVTFNRARQFAAPKVSEVWAPINADGYSLWSYPPHEVSAMVTTITTGSKILVQGDPSYFVIVDRIGLDVEVISNLFGINQRPTGQRGLEALWRNGAAVLNANAFRVLVAG
jgi:HK97 family phage major capsid protein